MVELQFTGQINTSLQVGDIVYYLQTSQVAGFDTASVSPTELGPVSEILVSNFNEYTIRINTSSPVPAGNNYYMFSKEWQDYITFWVFISFIKFVEIYSGDHGYVSFTLHY